MVFLAGAEDVLFLFLDAIVETAIATVYALDAAWMALVAALAAA